MLTVPKFLLSLALLALWPLISAPVNEQSKTAENIPAGWFVFAKTQLDDKHANPTLSSCPNESTRDWQVTSDGGSVKITDQNGKSEMQRQEKTTLPRVFKRQKGMPGNNVRFGLQAAMHFRNNWLIAYDAGEWGGGLWLTNEDGSESKRIIGDNVRQLVSVEHGVLVLSGLSHGIEFGNAYIFSEPDGMNIALQHAVHLDGVPSGYAKDADGSGLTIVNNTLWRITNLGEMTPLIGFPQNNEFIYSNSIVITPDGSIFIGMREFVLKLHKNASDYTKEWLLPIACRK
jgi:hypothetical protein